MTAATAGVVLAPTNPGQPGPCVTPDASGRVLVDGDPWTVLDTADQIRRALAVLDRSAKSRAAVLTALQLAGYWPTAPALNAYLLES